MSLRDQSDGGRSRAQMVLVAALLLAVTLVSLSLILNSVIYSENLASRQGVDSDRPLNFREAAEDAAVGSLNGVNFEQLDGSYTARKASFRSNMSSWRPGRFFAADGLDARAEVVGTTEGTRVGQPEFGPLEPNGDGVLESALNLLGLDYVSGDVDALLGDLDTDISGTQPSWVMSEGTNLRQFELEVQQSTNLVEVDDLAGLASIEAEIDGSTGPFWLQVEDDDGDRWFIFVYDDPDTTGTEVAQYYLPDNVIDLDSDGDLTVNDGTWNTTSTCTAEGQFSLDLTGGRVLENTDTGSGTPVGCSGLDAFEKVSGTPTVTVVNGGAVDARYRLVAENQESTFRIDVEDANNNLLNLGGLTTTESTFYGESSDPDGDGSRTDPYTNPALWSADVKVSFRQGPDRIRYSSTVPVTPGRPGEKSAVGGGGGSGGGQVDSDNQSPDASFTYSPSSPDKGETVNFDATGSSDSDGSIESYEWSFDDGTADSGSSLTNPSHSYSSTGDYEVSLTVTDDDGSPSTATKTISVTSSSASAPTVDTFSITDNSKNKNSIKFDVGWEVSDTDGDLSSVEVKLIHDPDGDGSGATDDQDSTSVSGGTAAGNAKNLKANHDGCGQNDYVIELTVTDETGQSTVDTKRVTPSC